MDRRLNSILCVDDRIRKRIFWACATSTPHHEVNTKRSSETINFLHLHFPAHCDLKHSTTKLCINCKPVHDGETSGRYTRSQRDWAWWRRFIRWSWKYRLSKGDASPNGKEKVRDSFSQFKSYRHRVLPSIAVVETISLSSCIYADLTLRVHSLHILTFSLTFWWFLELNYYLNLISSHATP